MLKEESPVVALNLHALSSFPELEGRIKARLAPTTNDIEIHLRNGKDHYFGMYFDCCLKLDMFVRHCRIAGITKIMILDYELKKREILTIEHLSRLIEKDN